MTDRRLAAICLWGGLAASMAANALMAPDVTAGATRMVAPVGQLLAFESLARGHRVAGWRRAVITVVGAAVWSIGAAVSYGHIQAYVALTEEAWIATVYPALADLIMTMGGLYLLWAPAAPAAEPATAPVAITNPVATGATPTVAPVAPARLHVVAGHDRPKLAVAAEHRPPVATVATRPRPVVAAPVGTREEQRSQVLAMARTGRNPSEIESVTGVARSTVRRWIAADQQEQTA